jgi:hypothetical protein
MNDEEFIRRFEDCTLSPEDFHHRDHVRLAWLYLRQHSTLEALAKFSTGLKTYAASLGKAALYHETITWAYMFLIQERVAQKDVETWQTFVAENADLFDWQENILKRYYREETLKSELAKRVFVFPDKPPSDK